jgi:hypothetical protein
MEAGDCLPETLMPSSGEVEAVQQTESQALIWYSKGCGTGAPTRWVQAVTVFEFEPSTGNFWFNPIRICNHRLTYKWNGISKVMAIGIRAEGRCERMCGNSKEDAEQKGGGFRWLNQ